MPSMQELLSGYVKMPAADIDPRIFWLLIGVDYHFIEKKGTLGILDFEEREPGCICAMANAFLHLCLNVANMPARLDLRSTEGETLSVRAARLVTRITKYHDICTKAVFMHQAVTPGIYRQSGAVYFFSSTNRELSPQEGTEEGIEYLRSRDHVRGFKLKDGSEIPIHKYYEVIQGELNKELYKIECVANPLDIDYIVKALSLRFMQDIENSANDDEIYLSLAEYIQDLMALHPFSDANNRVLVGLLLNEILVDLGYSATVLEQPNVFDGHTPQQLVAKIKEGQELFKMICTGRIALPADMDEYKEDLLVIALQSGNNYLIDMAFGDQMPSPITRSVLAQSVVLAYAQNKEGARILANLLINKEFLYILKAQLKVQNIDDKNEINKIFGEYLSLIDNHKRQSAFLFTLYCIALETTDQILANWCTNQLAAIDFDESDSEIFRIALQSRNVDALLLTWIVRERSVEYKNENEEFSECLMATFDRYIAKQSSYLLLSRNFNTNDILSERFLNEYLIELTKRNMDVDHFLYLLFSFVDYAQLSPQQVEGMALYLARVGKETEALSYFFELNSAIAGVDLFNFLAPGGLLLGHRLFNRTNLKGHFCEKFLDLLIEKQVVNLPPAQQDFIKQKITTQFIMYCNPMMRQDLLNKLNAAFNPEPPGKRPQSNPRHQ